MALGQPLDSGTQRCMRQSPHWHCRYRPCLFGFPSNPLSVRRVLGTIFCDLSFVSIADGEQHFFGVNQIAARLAVIFDYPGFNDGIHRAGLFAKATEDALGEIDVVARRTACAVIALLRFDGDCQRRANRFAKFASDAAFLAIGITAQRMQPSKTWQIGRASCRERV